MSARVILALVYVGAAVDGFVGLLAIFAQPLLGPVFDVPVKDPAVTTLLGGETLVAACVYLVLARDLDRYGALLYVVALDQLFAVILPGYEIARGHVVASWKTIGPMPLNAALFVAYLIAARSKIDDKTHARAARRALD